MIPMDKKDLPKSVPDFALLLVIVDLIIIMKGKCLPIDSLLARRIKVLDRNQHCFFLFLLKTVVLL